MPKRLFAPAKVFSTDIPRPRRAAPARPKVLSTSATYDVSLNKTNSFVVSKTIACTGANSSLAAYNSASYTLILEASSWNGYTVKSYDASNSVFRVTGGTTYIDLEFDYSPTYEALGPNDPGTWTLSAVDTSGASIELIQANIEIDKVTASQIDTSVTYTNTPVKLICKQGETFTRTITWKTDDVPVDLTGYTAAMQVRSSYSSTTAVVSLTTSNGGLTLGGAAGTIEVFISAVATSAIPAGNYVYDLELTTGTTVTRLLEGQFYVSPEVTLV